MGDNADPRTGTAAVPDESHLNRRPSSITSLVEPIETQSPIGMAAVQQPLGQLDHASFRPYSQWRSLNVERRQGPGLAFSDAARNLSSKETTSDSPWHSRRSSTQYIEPKRSSGDSLYHRGLDQALYRPARMGNNTDSHQVSLPPISTMHSAQPGKEPNSQRNDPPCQQCLAVCPIANDLFSICAELLKDLGRSDAYLQDLSPVVQQDHPLLTETPPTFILSQTLRGLQVIQDDLRILLKRGQYNNAPLDQAAGFDGREDPSHMYTESLHSRKRRRSGSPHTTASTTEYPAYPRSDSRMAPGLVSADGTNTQQPLGAMYKSIPTSHGLEGLQYPIPPSPTSIAPTADLRSRFPPASSTTYSEDHTRSSLYPSISTSSHATSHASAEATHFADLQRQITLKTLSLQTLQAEHYALIQKVERERTRIQTIERKSATAEKEVNSLIVQNEELVEQIKTLQVDLKEAEGKLEEVRRDTGKEKEQWVSMLAKGGKLMKDFVEERKGWVVERERLEALVGRRTSERMDGDGGDDGQRGAIDVADGEGEEGRLLRGKVSALSGQVSALRTALLGMSRDTENLRGRLAALAEDAGQAVTAADRALRTSS